MNGRISVFSRILIWVCLTIVFLNSLFSWHGICFHSLAGFLELCLSYAALFAWFKRNSMWRWLTSAVLMWDFCSVVLFPFLQNEDFFSKLGNAYLFSNPHLIQLIRFFFIIESIFIPFLVIVILFSKADTWAQTSFSTPAIWMSGMGEAKTLVCGLAVILGLYGGIIYRKGSVLRQDISQCGFFETAPPSPPSFFVFTEENYKNSTRYDIEGVSFFLPHGLWLEDQKSTSPYRLCSTEGNEGAIILPDHEDPYLEYENWYEFEWERYTTCPIKDREWWKLCQFDLENRMSVILMNSFVNPWKENKYAFESNATHGFVSIMERDKTWIVETRFSSFEMHDPRSLVLVFKKKTITEDEINDMLNVILNTLAIEK